MFFYKIYTYTFVTGKITNGRISMKILTVDYSRKKGGELRSKLKKKKKKRLDYFIAFASTSFTL